MPIPDHNCGVVNLKVKGQDGREVLFRMKRNTKLKKLIDAYYCHLPSFDICSVVLILDDGRRLRPEQTPDEVGMKDGDEIDIMFVTPRGAYG